MRTVATIIVAALLASPILAQDAPKPGPEHDWLKKRVGTWTTTLKAEKMEHKGTVTYKMELGGMWLIGSMESKLFGQKFSGKSIDSYNQAKKKYVGIWVDSMNTAPVTMEGTYDKKTKTQTMTGTGPGMDGKSTKFKSVTKFPDENTMIMTMYIGDGKEPTFTVTYKRKK